MLSDSVDPPLSPLFSTCDCLSEQWLTAGCIYQSCRLLSVVAIHQSGLWLMAFLQVLRHSNRCRVFTHMIVLFFVLYRTL